MIRGIVFVLLLGVATHALAAPTFETCASGVKARPAEYEPYRCYFEVASRNGEWQSAAMHLERLAAAHPHIDWIVFARALVATAVDKKAAELFCREAARRFEAASNIRGEMLARANLQVILYESGRVASAAREVERVTELGKRAQDPEIRIRARLVEAQFFISTGANLGRAYRALKHAESELDGNPNYFLRHHVLHDLGRVLLLTGQYDQAVTYFRRLQDEAATQQDLGTEARARLDVINTLLEKSGEEPDAVDMHRVYADADEALAAARRAQNVDLELDALRILGEAMMIERPRQASGYIDACVSQAQASGRPQPLSQCLWIQARLLADRDSSAAQRVMDAALVQLQSDEGADHRLLAYAWRHAMRLAWQIQGPQAAIETGKQALTAIERLRDLQPGLQSRAAAFSSWTQDYYWLSGQILRLASAAGHAEAGAGRGPTRAHLEDAFQIGERMRARTLLDRLRSSSLPHVDGEGSEIQQRHAVLESIAELNRQLLRASTNEDKDLLRKLESLERQELETREARDPQHVAVKSVSLAELQETLADNEALLTFQIGANSATETAGAGSWLFAITREDVRMIALNGRHSLTQALALFTGLMRQPPAHRERAAEALYDQLLADALSQMPAKIERLIVVPDFPVDTFPLAALGTRTGATRKFEPLAERFQIALVPSATLWHDWRTRSAPSRAASAASLLVIADPTFDFAGDVISQERSWMQASRLSLGALPHAREEGRRIIAQLGRGTLWIGEAASESALKASELSRHSVLHFAAHSVIDRANADRSAILLASGTDREDGLLQSREIADLRLDGQLVVLSSCQSAMGTHVRGEGVLGLARSFFASGARAVVGSLWPVRDDHARAFFERFYASLADGNSVGVAMAQTQRALVQERFPVEAWAGFVLMGDADVKPVMRVDSASEPRRTGLMLAILICALIATAAFARSRQKISARHS